MPYVYVNEVSDKKIQKLADPEQAEAVLQTISTLAGMTAPVAGDQVNQWLALLATNRIVAQKVKTSANMIEIYPGGKRAPDRIFMTVANGTVTIVAVGEASH
ncbi:hypothetical protein J5226_14485 [Lysobacter sp. K5869]|uniref:hypothetical protein n=1 Tax=Lysobacter sp. K5869 TaxID=2820808 RepID=UPI001C06202A|nr:hypothetical protein [Lysobacter sp. K5869]QWP74868.1 hypothetical protein J5226_14485 [Lysobacter sp. K5869]